MTIILEDGLRFCRGIEQKLKEIGYHCALAGSILIRGSSSKDIDVIIYPHDPGDLKDPLVIFTHLGFNVFKIDSTYINRKVYIYRGDCRVDFFIL